MKHLMTHLACQNVDDATIILDTITIANTENVSWKVVTMDET